MLRGEFIEHTNTYGFMYGLTRAELQRIRRANRVPVAILDVVGVRNVTAEMPTARIFVTAPLAQIERRMRRSRPADQVPARLQKAAAELLAAPHFDWVVVNEDGQLEEAVRQTLEAYSNLVRIPKPRTNLRLG